MSRNEQDRLEFLSDNLSPSDLIAGQPLPFLEVTGTWYISSELPGYFDTNCLGVQICEQPVIIDDENYFIDSIVYTVTMGGSVIKVIIRSYYSESDGRFINPVSIQYKLGEVGDNAIIYSNKLGGKVFINNYHE